MRVGVVATLVALFASTAVAADLRIGLAEDPDALDPALSRTFVGRIVLSSLCDKLLEVTPDLGYAPMLATGWRWSEDGLALTLSLREDVVFHDGTPFDADAVAFNIERSLTLPGSRRRSELSAVSGVTVLGRYIARIDLSTPDATLLAQLADRAGMMISPAAARAAGDEFGTRPVCSGPFRFLERRQLDRIVLERFSDHPDSDRIHVDTVVYRPVPDATVRLANLRAGDLDLIERVAATDLAAVREDDRLASAETVSLGYQAIVINVGNGAAAEIPLAKDPRIRRALSLAIDREALNAVVFDGVFTPGNQPVPPTSRWFHQGIPVPARDVGGARALLAEAGFERVAVDLQVANASVELQVAQMIQAMAAEAGFDVRVQAKEFGSLLADQSAGAFEASQIGWSGRIDPDGNLHAFVTCGGSINDGKYCNPDVDALLETARRSTDDTTRKAAYDAATTLLEADLPFIYLYHPTWIWAFDGKLRGFAPHPDGIVRVRDLRLD